MLHFQFQIYGAFVFFFKLKSFRPVHYNCIGRNHTGLEQHDYGANGANDYLNLWVNYSVKKKKKKLNSYIGLLWRDAKKVSYGYCGDKLQEEINKLGWIAFRTIANGGLTFEIG